MSIEPDKTGLSEQSSRGSKASFIEEETDMIVPGDFIDPEKSRVLQELRRTQEEDLFPASWSKSQVVTAQNMVQKENSAVGIMSSIPMRCKGSECVYRSSCPLVKNGIAPELNPCHPPGEMILTVKHGEVPIENLDPSKHRLYSYQRKGNIISSNRGKDSFGLCTKEYEGSLVCLSTKSGKSHKVTHDHISIAKFNENALGKFCVYLMRKENYWRIGKSTLACSVKESASIKSKHRSYLGFTRRGYTENADAMWLLGIYATNTEALIAEEYFSIKYQTSKMSFVDSLLKKDSKYNGLYKWATKEQIIKHHDSLSKDEDHYKKMLEELGLSINYPIWKKDGFEIETNLYVNWPMYVRACNILEEVMDVPTFSEERRSYSGKPNCRITDWEKVHISKEKYSGTVYSLAVYNKAKTYFAGKIATHNCPLELNLILSMFEGFCVELGVNPDENFIDSALIRDLCNVFIQEARVSKVLADEHFVIDNVLTVDRNNNVVYKKEPHIAIFYSNKLHSKKLQILNSLLATREARVKTMKATRSPISIGVNLQQTPGETMITMGNLLSSMNKKGAEERRKEYAYEIEEASFDEEISNEGTGESKVPLEEINLDSDERDDGFGWDQKN